jgi:hypothetical protein
MPVEELHKERERGTPLPDGVEISMDYKKRVSFWYEAKFFPEFDYVIQKPVYVGETCSYHIFQYAPRERSAYSVGLCYYMMDMLDINIVLLTTLVLQAFRYQKIEKEIVPDALKNLAEYKEHGHKAGVHAWVKEDWKRTNPHADAVKYKPLPDFPSGLVMLNQMLNESMQNTSGVTKTMAGTPEYSAMSGVAVAQHMSAGQIYHKEEQLKYQQFLTEIGKALMYDIAEFKSYAHYVSHLNENNQQEMVLVNDPENSPLTYEPERTTITCNLIENIEMVKQMEQELAMRLHQMGLMSGRRVLEYTSISNPSRTYEEAQHELGMKRVVDFLNQNPEMKQQIEMMMEQAA